MCHPDNSALLKFYLSKANFLKPRRSEMQMFHKSIFCKSVLSLNQNRIPNNVVIQHESCSHTHTCINVCVCDCKSTTSSPGSGVQFLLRVGAEHRYELLKGRKGFSAETVCFVERYKVTAFSIINLSCAKFLKSTAFRKD